MRSILALLCWSAPVALGCNATKACTYPSDNAWTVVYNATSDGRHVGQDCCQTMPLIPLVDTGANDPSEPGGKGFQIISPPSMKTEGAICPSLPGDVVRAQGLNPWRNGSLYPRERIYFAEGYTFDGPSGHAIPKQGPGVGVCQRPHPFYTKYVLARSHDAPLSGGIPVLGSAVAPDAALRTSAATIAEILRQMDGKVPGIRDAMVRHAQRFAVWADSERRTDTCKICTEVDPYFDCNAHIDSRAGRDASYHPENPYCQELGGGGGLNGPTSGTEEYGIPYLEPNGTIRDSYCGTNIIAHEFFHSIHDVGIQQMAYPLFLKIEQGASKAVREGLYVHHPGARDDGCNDDFSRCVTYEFIVKAHMTWNGFPADSREFVFSSRKEIKEKAPWIAQLVYALFEDGDWNPALGAVINEPRDQTFGLTCKTAPGSALCGKPLSKEYTGIPMSAVLAKCGGDCWAAAGLGNWADPVGASAQAEIAKLKAEIQTLKHRLAVTNTTPARH